MRPQTLAPRRQNLAHGRVLLFDNGKLAHGGPLSTIFDIIGDRLQARFPDVDLLRRTQDLLQFDAAAIDDVVSEIASSAIDGVVLAICDWGVSQPTALTAAGLESALVPCTIIATREGHRQIQGTIGRLVPGLPVTGLDYDELTSAAALVEQTRSSADRVIDGLISPGQDSTADLAADIRIPEWRTETGTLDLPESEASQAFTSMMAVSHLGDGLPLVAPTVGLVDEFCAAGGARHDELIWPAFPPRTSSVLAHDVAIVAVAAGCRPQWAPVVFAAFRAMGQDEFRLFQAAVTTYPGGTLVLVSGPNSHKFGFESGAGALGPGFAANATTGRAVALGYSFLLGAVPRGADFCHQSSPAKYSYCFAENISASPWPGLHADLGFADRTTVTVLKCEGPHNVLDQRSDTAPQLLDTFSSSLTVLGANSSYVPQAQMILALNPMHARKLNEWGWGKEEVRSYLFETARNDPSSLLGRGIPPIPPRGGDSQLPQPVVSTPDDFLIAVAGAAGPASQVILPWGFARAVTEPVP